MSYCQQGNLPNSGDGWATAIGDTPPSVAVVTAPDDWATAIGDTPPSVAVVTAPDDWSTFLGDTSWDISVVFSSSEKNKPKKV